MRNTAFQACANTKYFIVQIADFINGSMIPFILLSITSAALFIAVANTRRKTRNKFKFKSSNPILEIANFYFKLNSTFRIIRTVLVLFYIAYFSMTFYVQIAINSIVPNTFFDLVRKFKLILKKHLVYLKKLFLYIHFILLP